MDRIKFKIRHQPEFNSGSLIRDEKGIRILSDAEISGIAPGQFGVIYDIEKKTCLGSGVIIEHPV